MSEDKTDAIFALLNSDDPADKEAALVKAARLFEAIQWNSVGTVDDVKLLQRRIGELLVSSGCSLPVRCVGAWALGKYYDSRSLVFLIDGLLESGCEMGPASEEFAYQCAIAMENLEEFMIDIPFVVREAVFSRLLSIGSLRVSEIVDRIILRIDERPH